MQHDLAPSYPQLLEFNSTAQLRASSLYARLGAEIERVLATVTVESFARPRPGPSPSAVRVAAWNIERGRKLEGVIRALRSEPQLAAADVFLMTELDHGMARTGNRSIAREIAKALELDYAFAPCYLSLVKGSGVEYDVEGDNAEAIHGNALFSRYPLSQAHSLALPNGIDKMSGKEKRLGCQRVVVAVVEHPLGPFRALSVHLDAQSSQRHRMLQMRRILDHVDGLEPRLPVVLGGDFNTSTYNSRRALYAILGYWRRVLMGPARVIRDHYPYPDRYFERGLFGELEGRGYRYRDLNEPGGCTVHYDVEDITANAHMADWIPGWCFWFIRQALRGHRGRCSLKLDWLAGRDVAPAPGSQPSVVRGLNPPSAPLSDHDPVVADLVLKP